MVLKVCAHDTQLSLEYPALLASKASYWQLSLLSNLRCISMPAGQKVAETDNGMLVEMTGDDASRHRRLCSRAPVTS